MKHTSIVLLALAAVSPLPSQGDVCSPPFHVSTEGGYYSYAYFGARANSRIQLGTGHVPVGSVLKSLRFRHDDYNYTAYVGSSRTWSNVTLSIGPSDLSAWDGTFSTNFTSTPTSVFSGSVTWASIAGYPSSIPAKWGDGGLGFAFGAGGTNSSYSHSTSADVCNDFGFSGGRLSNGGTATQMYYRLDSWNPPTEATYGEARYLPPTRLDGQKCRDSAMSSDLGAYIVQTVATHGSLYSEINLRDRLRFQSYSYHTAPGALVLHVHSFSHDEKGLGFFNTGCNRLHVTGELLIEPRITLPANVSSSGYSGYYDWVVPWQKAYAGLEATSQAAWTDSKTGQLLLSQASSTRVPAAPVSMMARRNMCWNDASATATTGTYLPTHVSSGWYNPSMCYGK